MEAQIKKIDKKFRVGLYDLVRFQVYTEFCFLRKEHLTELDLDILVLLGINGLTDLSKFCNKSARLLYPKAQPEEYSIKSQNIRNRIVKLEKRGMIEKTKDGLKKIRLKMNPEIVRDPNVLLSYNFLHVETAK